jgi:hypothetical protein
LRTFAVILPTGVLNAAILHSDFTLSFATGSPHGDVFLSIRIIAFAKKSERRFAKLRSRRRLLLKDLRQGRETGSALEENDFGAPWRARKRGIEVRRKAGALVRKFIKRVIVRI